MQGCMSEIALALGISYLPVAWHYAKEEKKNFTKVCMPRGDM